MRSLAGITGAIIVCGVLLVWPSAPAFAHDGDIVTTFPNLDPQQFEHPDQAPWKGWLNVTATNNGTVAWGDFHFEFYDPIGGQDLSNLAFRDASLGGEDPTSSQSPLTWLIDNDAVPATMDLFYYSDPVGVGETATFSVYTDNTVGTLPIFGMIIYPTPIPEPGTVLLLGLGALLIRRSRL